MLHAQPHFAETASNTVLYETYKSTCWEDFWGEQGDPLYLVIIEKTWRGSYVVKKRVWTIQKFPYFGLGEDSHHLLCKSPLVSPPFFRNGGIFWSIEKKTEKTRRRIDEGKWHHRKVICIDHIHAYLAKKQNGQVSRVVLYEMLGNLVEGDLRWVYYHLLPAPDDTRSTRIESDRIETIGIYLLHTQALRSCKPRSKVYWARLDPNK